MTIARRLVVAFLLAIALSACTLELPTAASAERYSGGAPVQLTEQQLRLLSAWFEAHQSGWSHSYVTYVPATYVRVAHVGGQSSTINIWSPTKVVVNYDGSQIEQQFEASSVQTLISIVGPNGG